MSTDLFVACLALTTSSVSLAANDNDLVSNGQVGGLWYAAPDLFHGAGNLVPGYRRKLEGKCLFEVAFDQLNVGAAHTGRFDFNENFFRTDLRSFHLFKYEWLVITVHSCCEHVWILLV
jgi:hypothetical protein